MQVIGRPDLAADPALQRNDGRVPHAAMLDAAIQAWTAQHDVATILAALEKNEIPAGRIYSVADIVADPHYQARDMILGATLPDGTKMKMPGVVPKLSATPGEVRWLGPELGQHTSEILRDLRFDDEEIARLRAQGAVA
jgi:crotonobetainyl-CoA:carnitine CoA-transferase CaiB-like acyl-CoA transferase